MNHIVDNIPSMGLITKNNHVSNMGRDNPISILMSVNI